MGNYLISDFNHGLINSFGVASDFESAVFGDVSKSTKHVCARDSDLVKHEPAVVFAIVSKFCSDVSDLNTF